MTIHPHPHGLLLPTYLSYPEWQSALRECLITRRRNWWETADLLLYGETHWRETYAQDIDLSQISFHTLTNMLSLARQYSHDERYPCSPSHHDVVRAMPDERRRYWLARAVGEQLSRDELREMTAQERGILPASGNGNGKSKGEPVTAFWATFDGGMIPVPAECALALQAGKRYQVAFYETEQEAV